jgi:TonB family protein
MALRCLLFTSDMGTAAPICQVLADLAVEPVHCAESGNAAEIISSQPFQIFIIDWDMQPEATALLQMARERKVSERPLTLAIVGDDVSVPKALQAGANSILRTPILINQVKDTLKTARDLLRARESAATAAHAAAAGTAPWPGPAASTPASEATLRAGEFLQSSAPASPTQIDTESQARKSLEQSAAEDVHQLKDLEPMAAAVVPEKPAPPPLPLGQPRGLQWYLNKRPSAAPAPAPASHPLPPSSSAPSQPELLGYDQTPSYCSTAPRKSDDPWGQEPSAPTEDERKVETELFAYIDGERNDSRKREHGSHLHLGKGAIIGALVLAACGIAAAPQAPWHAQLRTLWTRGRQAMHVWLNPQPVTPPQAPAAHEDFGRPGDEYKLPVAEAIPDATTDPSQIRVLPVVDPTLKKPNNIGANADPNAASADGTAPNPGDATHVPGAQSPGIQVQTNQVPVNTGQDNPAPGNQPTPTAQVTVQPANRQVAAGTNSLPATPVANAEPVHSDPFKPSAGLAPARPSPPRNPQPRPTAGPPSPSIPSSLRSQMASMTPDASGNKAPETALPSIEPVDVPEAAERALLTDQPPIAYPANAKTLQGTVVLQVLVGRDGTVQDAKFLQGSLAFARTAIDGVKQWKFKPYTMNGRAVSVQTKLTLSFKPGQ